MFLVLSLQRTVFDVSCTDDIFKMWYYKDTLEGGMQTSVTSERYIYFVHGIYVDI